jgi:exopolysaccharide biosynthesis polyprenyl glycosylphosphotransferase
MTPRDSAAALTRELWHRTVADAATYPVSFEPRPAPDLRAVTEPRELPSLRPRAAVNATAASVLFAADGIAFLVACLLLGATSWRWLGLGVVIFAVRVGARVYRPRLHLSVLEDLPRTTASLLGAFSVTLAVVLVANGDAATDRTVLGLCTAFLLLSVVGDECVFAIGRRLRRAGIGMQRTVIVGAGQVGAGLAKTLTTHPELGLSPVGFVDSDALTTSDDLPCPLLSSHLPDLRETLLSSDASVIVIAFGAERESSIVDAIIAAQQSGCGVYVVPRMFELHHDAADVERVRGIPLHRLSPDPTLRLSWWAKIAIDVLTAALALVVLSPLLLLVALGILWESGRPVLFWQERVGLDGRTFRLCKFRSMRPIGPEDASDAAWSAVDDPRLSKVGKLLRRTSFDEVPQLWNIIRRDMSLVGPRPERPEYVRRFSSEHERYWARHRVPAGMTGLAQVNGLRGDTSIRERARYDNYYIANWSLWLDVKVLMLTAREVCRLRGQ